MTYEERATIRRMISDRRRELLGEAVCPIGVGSEWGYKKGCRCSICMKASSDKRRERRERAPLTRCKARGTLFDKRPTCELAHAHEGWHQRTVMDDLDHTIVWKWDGRGQYVVDEAHRIERGAGGTEVRTSGATRARSYSMRPPSTSDTT